MKLHFIAIGGSAMHNLAIAMAKTGYQVTGSDDEIFEPARSRLQKYDLLPSAFGWEESRIHKDLDAIILGMHAKKDNPELIKAQKLGLRIYSYPEFLYEQSRNKTRVVIGGSHGKTTITAMILHVLNYHNIETDFMVGAQIKGFDVMVKLSENAPFIVLEGDEYLSSAIDPRPKFHLYKPDIALLSGIAWDHINVFPTFENYLDQFRQFINLISPKGSLIYSQDDPVLNRLILENQNSLKLFPYKVPEHEIHDGVTFVTDGAVKYPISVFGKHNLMNMNGALKVCEQMGVSKEKFFEAIKSFKGAGNRLEMIAQNNGTIVFKDFAHAPSKLKATTSAVREQYPDKELVACMELHTFSSLNRMFLSQYRNSMNDATHAVVFCDPHALKMKNLPEIDHQEIISSFNREDMHVVSDKHSLEELLKTFPINNSCFLFMSSGNFGGFDLKSFASSIQKTNTKIR